ncbi:MAG: ABC transporter permease [Gammaproteobacteria bacterium]|nr:ABC transporter permease [Gammaproteobacteria bacterium]
MTVPLIELRNICRRYATGSVSVAALEDVDLVIQPGEFVAVMGPSGSGKSTLMNIIGCLDRPSDGEYYFRGEAVHRADADELARLRREVFGFVFQSYNLLGMATARENVEIPAIYAGTPRRARASRATSLLKGVGLSHRLRHQPGELSGGEQQRVAIARALMNGGRVVLADEPTGSLDSASGREIIALLEALSNQGHTIILVTHDPNVAAHAHRRIQLLDGHVVADDGLGLPSNAGTNTPTQADPHNTVTRAPVSSFRDSVRTAMRALRTNRLRTSLTLLGIIIGVLSVTAMLGLAEGVQRGIMDSFRLLGGASLQIQPSFDQDGRATTLTIADADAIRDEVPNVISVTPQMSGGARILAGGATQFARFTATTAVSMASGPWTLAEGVYFTASQDRNHEPVVVLGGILAGALFGEQGNAVGEHILLDGSPYQVIGVLKRPEDTGYHYHAYGFFVPLRTGAIRLLNKESLDTVGVLVAETHQVDAAQRAIDALLVRRHGQRDFQIQNQEAALEAQNNVSNILRMLFGAIGGISLVVAGIGVMNIMLATVAERTREIGLRMAIGARRRDILFQFICEAVVVAGLGGIVGLGLALVVGEAINMIGATVMAFTAPILLIGLSCATLTGLFFGLAPARRAAGMDPVAALAAQ